MPAEERISRASAGTAREKILAEALRLFVAKGYQGTTIEAIARGAGVAVQTVYFVFGNKRTLLKHLVDRNVAGDDQPIPTLERGWVREAIEEPDPHRHLRIQVRAAGEIYRRVAPLLDVMRGAAFDEEVAELWRTNQKQRRTVQRRLITALAKKRPLANGLTIARATDISYTTLGPELFHILVTERGWSVTEWERWTLRVLRAELLGGPEPA